MFATEFGAIARHQIDLYPQTRRSDIDRVISEVYPSINNGVYRAGLAATSVPIEICSRHLTTGNRMDGKACRGPRKATIDPF